MHAKIYRISDKKVKNHDELKSIIDLKYTFKDFTDTLQELCPQYYSDAVVNKVKKLIQ